MSNPSRVYSSVRARARALLGRIPPEVNSKTNGNLFYDLTRVWHSDLEKAWAAGSSLTTCNAFTGIYGGNLGSKVPLGSFWPETTLKQAGRAHAWVASGSGGTPGYGDVFFVDRYNPQAKRKDLHTGIVLECSGASWHTIESGQGGPNMGADLILRKFGPFERSRVKGWVDIDGLFQGPHAAHESAKRPVPDWIVGWWAVQWRGSTYYYSFDAKNGVGYSKEGPGRRITVFGVATPATGNSVTIYWPGTGTNELFEAVGVGVMRGRWNNSEQMFAKYLGK